MKEEFLNTIIESQEKRQAIVYLLNIDNHDEKILYPNEKTGNKDSQQTSVDTGKNDKTNCDTEQPPTREKIIHTGSEKSQVDEKHSKAEGSNLNSSPDIVNSTSKKVYKTEMI